MPGFHSQPLQRLICADPLTIEPIHRLDKPGMSPLEFR